MKTSKKIVGVLLLAAVLVACNTKDSYLNKFEDFILEVETEYENYSSEDWAGADAQFDAFATTEYQKYENKLTPEDRNQIGRLTARYAKVRYKSAIQLAGDYVEDVMDVVEGFVDEMEEEGEDE